MARKTAGGGVELVFPTIARIGSVTLHSYGFAMAVAFLAAGLYVRHECVRRDIGAEAAIDFVLAAAVGGIVGARLAYVVAHWSYFISQPIEILKISQGGLVFYGGLAGGAVAVLALVVRKGVSVPLVADAAAPAVAIGSAIGRIGCLLNGCCYGRETTSWLGITFPEPLGGPRMPTQVVDGLYNLGIFVLLAFLAHRYRLKPGFIFWLYAALYAASRFGIEFMRENALLLAGLSGAQIISIGFFTVSVAVLLLYYRRPLEEQGVGDVLKKLK